ncbi:MAG TPA: hypothetical protein VFA89_22805 [Terriglobales bacterium]|nr:hypothetical protein [Terriglobales bacterium]
MTATHKSNKTATAAEKNEMLESFFPLYIKSVERMAEMQKKTLDMAAQQNADWLEIWKKAARMVPQAPGMFLFDLYAQMFERFVETEKGAIDLVVEQTHQATGLVKERGTSYGKATDGFTGLFQHALDHTIAAQKKGLDFFAEQQKTAYDAVKRQFRFVNNPAADAFQSGLDTLIETQKAMLDIATKPLHKTAVM